VRNGRVITVIGVTAALLLQAAAAAALGAAPGTPVLTAPGGNAVPTSVSSPGVTRIALEAPGESAVLPSSFAASGWALEPDAPSGTGVDAIQIYAYRNFGSGEAPQFLGNASYGLQRSDVAGSYGDQFADSGFSLDVSGLPAGNYRLFVFAHNVATDGYTAYVYADVAVAPFSAIVTDAPADGATATSAFEVTGWALDNHASSGTGVDAIHVYVTPDGGGAVFLGVASLGWTRNDVASLYGAQFAPSGYHFTVTGLPPGDYVLSLYGHTTATNTFTLVASRPVRVAAQTLLSIDTPAAESTAGGRAFAVSGWALDRAAVGASGIDTLHVYAFPDPGSGRAPIFLGAATVGYGRSDVAAAYGSQYDKSGYGLAVDADAAGLAPGIYDIVVWAHSSVTGSFTAVASVRVRLP
jgi:hypothetical protein